MRGVLCSNYTTFLMKPSFGRQIQPEKGIDSPSLQWSDTNEDFFRSQNVECQTWPASQPASKASFLFKPIIKLSKHMGIVINSLTLQGMPDKSQPARLITHWTRQQHQVNLSCFMFQCWLAACLVPYITNVSVTSSLSISTPRPAKDLRVHTTARMNSMKLHGETHRRIHRFYQLRTQFSRMILTFYRVSLPTVMSRSSSFFCYEYDFTILL